MVIGAVLLQEEEEAVDVAAETNLDWKRKLFYKEKMIIKVQRNLYYKPKPMKPLLHVPNVTPMN